MDEQIVDFSQPRERAMFVSAINRLTGKHRVTFIKYRKRRTDAQNRYYRGVIVECLRAFLREQGEMYTGEQAHQFLAFKFLSVPVIHAATGEELGNRVRSTTELNTAEFAEYIELCISYLADMFHIVVPDPEWRSQPCTSNTR